MREITVVSVLAFSIALSARAEWRFRIRPIPDVAGSPGSYVGASLNNEGTITGVAWLGASGSGPYAFVSRRAGESPTQFIGSLPSCSVPYAESKQINDQGHVAGDDQGVNCDATAFLWTQAGGMLALGDLPGGITYSLALGMNALDQVVGWSVSGSGEEAFLWSATTGMVGLGDLPGGQFLSIAGAINDNSWIIGGSCSGEAGCSESFLWTPEDGMIALRQIDPTLPHFDAADINNAGQIAGMAWIGQRRDGGVWDEQNGLTLFGYLTDEPDEYLLPYDVNDHGVVVGYSWNDRMFGAR